MRFVSDALRRLARRDTVEPVPPEAPGIEPPLAFENAGLAAPVDAYTRDVWAAAGEVTATVALVGGPPSASRRVAELVAAAEAPPQPARPRANPAFSEALFVELLRAGQYRRAYGLLAPECQEVWGSLEAFTAAQEGRANSRLLGVEVHEVRYLPLWSDPEAGRPYAQVAELEAEYRVGDAGRPTVLRRTVHLVPVDGRWRSLCYPERPDAVVPPLV